MEIELRDRDLQLLKSLKLSDKLSGKISDAVAVIERSQERDYTTGRFRIDLDGEQIERTVEALGDLLVETGIDENGEISVVGREIESLIDVFVA